MKPLIVLTFALGVALAAAAPTARAQTTPSSSPERPPIALEPKPEETIAGRAAFYRGTATPERNRFLVEGLDMLTPVVVGVQAVDAGAPVHLALYKDTAREPARAAVTDHNGQVFVDFRTYPKVFIDVSAEKPSGYVLTVWVGPLREAEVRNPFVAPGGGPGAARWMWPTAAGAALLAVIGIWLVFRLRKRALTRGISAGSIALVAMLGFDTPVGAQFVQKPGGPPNISEVRSAIEVLQKFLEMKSKFKPLSDEDIAYEPELAPPGMPLVTLNCASWAPCRECFVKAYGDLTDIRKKLENNRIVLTHFHHVVQYAEDFGRSVAGLGMAAGALFLKNKAEWDAQRAAVDANYDLHYTELMNDLPKALQAIEQCEFEHFRYSNWYNRSGFMYYEFMAAHYRRTS